MEKGSIGYVSELRFNDHGPRFSAVITLEQSQFEGTEDFGHLKITPPIDFQELKVQRGSQGEPQKLELLSNAQLPLAQNEKVWLYIQEEKAKA